MSAKMSKATFQRFTLLYLIGQFPKGVFSGFRLQKALYYATRDTEPKPFTFRHTEHGQYSCDAAAALEVMLEGELLRRKELAGGRPGARWLPGDMLDQEAVAQAYEQAFPPLAAAIRASVSEYGYLRQPELDERVHADPMLAEIPRGEILHAETADDAVETLLSEDECEDFELTLAPRLLSILKRFVEVAKTTDFDSSKVRVDNTLV